MAGPRPDGTGGPRRSPRLFRLLLPALLAQATNCSAPPPPTPGPAPPAAGSPSCGLPVEPRQGLLVAGSGANLALVRRIAERFEQLHPQLPVQVPPSIGTAGAAQAVHDGVVDVGLTSRWLKEGERALGLHETPLARVAVVAVASAGVPDAAIAPETLLAALRGEERRWSDGRPILPLLREAGDSSNEVFRTQLPGFRDALARAFASGSWRVCITDQEMEQALLQTPGAVGLLDEGTLALGPAHGWARALRLGELVASPEAVRSGKYPFTKDLAFVTQGRPHGDAALFVDFARSAAVQDLLDAGGYVLLPLYQE